MVDARQECENFVSREDGNDERRRFTFSGMRNAVPALAMKYFISRLVFLLKRKTLKTCLMATIRR